MARAENSELTHQLTNTSSGYELVVSPALMGWFGYWLDGKFDLRPVLTISFAIFGVIGAFASSYARHRLKMAKANEEALSTLAAKKSAQAEARQAAAEAREAEQAALAAELEAAESAFQSGQRAS